MHRSVEGNSLETSAHLTAGKERMIAGETIAAISTPAGEGAIALIRVSGIDAIAVADEIFRGTPRVTPAKIWSRSVATAERLSARKYWKRACGPVRVRRDRANSPSAHFSMEKWT